MIVGVDALSIGIENFQEHLIVEIVDRQVSRLCARGPTSALTCRRLIADCGESLSLLDVLLFGEVHGGLTVSESWLVCIVLY